MKRLLKSPLRMKIAAALAAAAATAAAVSAAAADPAARAADDPSPGASRFRPSIKARSLYDGMLETMRGASSLSYASEFTTARGGVELGRSRYALSMRKPNLIRLESSTDLGARRGVLVGDGASIWIYWPSGRPWRQGGDSVSYAANRMISYVRKSAPREGFSVSREINLLGTGIPMTVFEPGEFYGVRDALEGHLEGVSYVGAEQAGGEECDVIEASYLRGERRRFFWIARRDRLPRRVKLVVRADEEVVNTEELSRISLNGDSSDTLFAWKPPAGWVEHRLPSMEDGLLRAGAPAPDFTLALADGAPFRLSASRGTVIWLVFWRLSCPPCRKELPRLEKLHRRFQGKGVAIVGFNSTDEPALAREYLRERRISFPNVLDTSKAAKDLYYDEYQRLLGVSAMPLNYIIDGEGRVAAAWYGYDGIGKGLEVLKRLGIKG